VTITAWRIVSPQFSDPVVAFSGEGARRNGGRWNNKGVPVTYTSESPSLAILELRVNVLPDPDLVYVLIPITFRKDLIVEVPPKELPADWRQQPAPATLKALGDAWAQEHRSVVLKVPSAVVEIQSNYLINPEHKSFPKDFEIGDPIEYRFDPRLI
jgi:RES domain-containing protein